MKTLAQLYQEIQAMVENPSVNQCTFIVGAGLNDYKLKDIDKAAIEFNTMGFQALIYNGNELVVTDPATRFHLAERLPGQEELDANEIMELNAHARKVLVTKRDGKYTLHFHMNPQQGRQVCPLVAQADEALIVLLNAAPTGGIPVGSPLGERLVRKVRDSLGQIVTPADVIHGKEIPSSLKAVVTAYQAGTRAAAATAPAAAPAGKFQPFDLGFDMARLEGVHSRDHAFSALLACLTEVRGATTIDAPKRTQVIQKLLSMNDQGEYASHSFPINPAGNIAITTHTWVKSFTQAPQSHDGIGQLAPDLRVVVLERTNARGESSGIGLPGGLLNRPVEAASLRARSQIAAIESTQFKLGRAQAMTVKAFKSEDLKVLEQGVVDFGFLTQVLPTAAELERLKRLGLISDTVYGHIQGLVAQASPSGQGTAESIKIAVSSSFAIEVPEQELAAFIANDTIVSEPLGNIRVSVKLMDLNDVLYLQNWFYRHEFYSAILPLLYENLPMEERAECFKSYLRQATERTMELMRADIMNGRFPTQISLEWPASKIFTEWSKHIRIDFDAYLRAYPTVNRIHYAAQFGMNEIELADFSDELHGLCTSLMRDLVPLIEERKEGLVVGQLLAYLIPGVPSVCPAAAANMDLDLLVSPISYERFSTEVRVAGRQQVAYGPVRLLADGYCYNSSDLDAVNFTGVVNTGPDAWRVAGSPFTREMILIDTRFMPAFEALDRYNRNPIPENLRLLCTDGLYTLAQAHPVLAFCRQKINRMMTNPVMLMVGGVVVMGSRPDNLRYFIIDQVYADQLMSKAGSRVPDEQRLTPTEIQALQAEVAVQLGLRAFDARVVRQGPVVNFSEFIAANAMYANPMVAKAEADDAVAVGPHQEMRAMRYDSVRPRAAPKSGKISRSCSFEYQECRDDESRVFQALGRRNPIECAQGLQAMLAPEVLDSIIQGRSIRVVVLHDNRTCYLIARAQRGGVKIVPVTLDPPIRGNIAIFFRANDNIREICLTALVDHGACLPAHEVVAAPLKPGQTLAARFSLREEQPFEIGFDPNRPINTPKELMAALAACLKINPATRQPMGIDPEKRLEVLRRHVLQFERDRVVGARLLDRLTAGTTVITTHGGGVTVTPVASIPENQVEYQKEESELPELPLLMFVMARYKAEIPANCRTPEGWRSFASSFAEQQFDGLCLPGGIENSGTCLNAAQAMGGAKLKSISRLSTGITPGQQQYARALFEGVPDIGTITQYVIPTLVELQELRATGLIGPDVFDYYHALHQSGNLTAATITASDKLGLVISNIFRLEVDPRTYEQMIQNAGGAPNAPAGPVHLKGFTRRIHAVLKPSNWKFAHEFYCGVLPALYQAVQDLNPADAGERQHLFEKYLKDASKNIAMWMRELIAGHHAVGYYPAQLNIEWTPEELVASWKKLAMIDPLNFCAQYGIPLAEYAATLGMSAFDMVALTQVLANSVDQLWAEFFGVENPAGYIASLIAENKEHLQPKRSLVMGASALSDPVRPEEFEARVELFTEQALNPMTPVVGAQVPMTGMAADTEARGTVLVNLTPAGDLPREQASKTEPCCRRTGPYFGVSLADPVPVALARPMAATAGPVVLDYATWDRMVVEDTAARRQQAPQALFAAREEFPGNMPNAYAPDYYAQQERQTATVFAAAALGPRVPLDHHLIARMADRILPVIREYQGGCVITYDYIGGSCDPNIILRSSPEERARLIAWLGQRGIDAREETHKAGGGNEYEFYLLIHCSVPRLRAELLRAKENASISGHAFL